MKTLVHYVVWGAPYINRFLNFALPTQLSPGNIGALAKGSALRIVTRKSDHKLIDRSKAIAFARTIIDVDIVAMPDAYFERAVGDKYSIVRELQNEGLKDSSEFDAVIFGYGDALWAEGSYKNALDRLAAGHDLVLCIGVNVVENDVIKILEKKYSARQINKRAIAPRAFMDMVYKNLHVIARSRFWDHPHMNNYPSFLLWDVKDKGILAHAFHLHPVAIRVRHGDTAFFRPFDVTIDEGLVPRLLQEGAVPYISDCSDEMFVCGLAGEIIQSHLYHYPLRPPNISDVVNFAERSASLQQHLFFEKPLRLICSGDVADDEWQQAEREASRICGPITRCLFLPTDVLQWEAPLAYEARMARRLRVPKPQRRVLAMTLSDIKTADTRLLKDIAIQYIDRKGLSIFALLGLGSYWAHFRRSVRRQLEALFRARNTEPPMEAGPDSPLEVNFNLPPANFWQVVVVSAVLLSRSRRSAK